MPVVQIQINGEDKESKISYDSFIEHISLVHLKQLYDCTIIRPFEVTSRHFFLFLSKRQKMLVQQGLEMRAFWFQKKNVQLKTALREVYTYVLNGIFFQKTVTVK